MTNELNRATNATSAGEEAHGRLRVTLGINGSRPDPRFAHSMDLEGFADLVRSAKILRHMLRYRDVVAMTAHDRAFPRPFAVETCLRLLSRGSCVIESEMAGTRPITWRSCAAAGARMIRDGIAVPGMMARVEQALSELERLNTRIPALSQLPQTGALLHLRTDLWLGVKAGGAIAHTAGIANALAECGFAPVCAGFEPNNALSPAVRQSLLPLPDRFWDFPERPAIAANLLVAPALDSLIDEVAPRMIYHRLAAFSFMGALAARRRNLLLIVEYNGSEVWIARNWGRAFRHDALAVRMESAVLAAADRIVVVSTPLRDELVARGIPRDRIRVVMNGVDTARFHPSIDAAAVRRRLGMEPAHTVIGFIGTFGVWHGVPILVEAYAKMLQSNPSCRDKTRLLLIGDGQERSAIERRIETLGLGANIVRTGTVTHSEAPSMLAAADILVAPHLANADQSPFFGSPTKLFEYMSMGRCIVASRLDQIADVLSHGECALLVQPGDIAALASALAHAVDTPELRSTLGDAARAKAVTFHDWKRRLDTIFGA